MPARPPAKGPRVASRWTFAGAATAFALAAAAAAIARSQQPFDHGWWLVAYLALVGALSQLILGSGQLTWAPGLAATSRGTRVLGAEVVLWNLGAALVPVGVLLGTPRSSPQGA